jgi:hypothetical protein
MLIIRAAEPQQLRNNWGFVEEGLNAVIRKTHAEFIAADVYAAIMAQRVWLYWVIDGEYTIGFVVLSDLVETYTGKKTLFAEQVYFDPKYMRDNLPEELDAALEELAVKCGCKSLEGNSPRMGAGRRLRRLGYQPVTVTYKRDL